MSINVPRMLHVDVSAVIILLWVGYGFLCTWRRSQFIFANFVMRHARHSCFNVTSIIQRNSLLAINSYMNVNFSCHDVGRVTMVETVLLPGLAINW